MGKPNVSTLHVYMLEYTQTRHVYGETQCQHIACICWSIHKQDMFMQIFAVAMWLLSLLCWINRQQAACLCWHSN